MNKTELEAFIDQLNERWLAADYPALQRCYHPDAVLLPPDAGDPIIGRESVIATYRDFHSLATISEFQVTDLQLMCFPDTAMCHMRFDIAYSLNQLPLNESGLEVYTLIDDPTMGPQIIWRAQFTL